MSICVRYLLAFSIIDDITSDPSSGRAMFLNLSLARVAHGITDVLGQQLKDLFLKLTLRLLEPPIALR